MRHVTHVQWNPVNMVTNGPRKIGGINRVAILTRVFFTRKCMAVFGRWPIKGAVITTRR